MREVRTTPKFDRAYKKFVRDNAILKQAIDEAIKQMALDVFAPSLETHKLSGKLFKAFSCSVDTIAALSSRSREVNQQVMKLPCCMTSALMMKSIDFYLTPTVRNTMKRIFTGSILLFLLAYSVSSSQPKRPLELADMFKIKRISDPALSPDGKWAAFILATPSFDENRNISDLWLASTDGMAMKQLTNDAASDRHPAWSPDGKWIAFEKKDQVFLISREGGEAKQLTNLSNGAAMPVWSPNGTMIAFVSDVFPEFSHLPFSESDAKNKAKLDKLENGKVKARALTQLFYRNWDSWLDGKRQHIFVQAIDGTEPKDLTPGDRDAFPRSSTFAAGIDFSFSPDGKEIAYVASPTPTQEEAWNTNFDIYTLPVGGGAPKLITTNNAADNFPMFSPDGKFIAYRAQSVPGFEADRWQLMLYERASGKTRSLTKNFDSHVETFVWSPESKVLYFYAEENATRPIFSVSINGNDVKKIFDKGSNGSLCLSKDGKRLLFAHQRAVRPTELYAVDVGGGNLKKITGVNDELFTGLDIPEPESVWFTGAGGTKVQSWIFKPTKMVEGAKYPFVYLVHGGPQGAWMDSWSYRWCPALWAAQGYIVMAPNPRGSSGFGQKFMEEISRDWGGKAYVDLMKGLDYAEKLPYVDKEYKAAAGASFGGYMMHWFAAKTGKRFKTIITHSGIYNSVSMYGTTEELWFDEWEHGTPWEDAKEYAKFSPHTYAKNFSTPMLIIHGEKDYRVPVQQAMEAFSMLQRRGIPSKFLYFPDENHWILKPANSKLWHETVFEWLKEHLGKGDALD